MNTGLHWPNYVYFLFVLAAIGMLAWIARDIVKAINMEGLSSNKALLILAKLAFSALVVIAVFFSYGPGQPTPITAPEDEGYRQRIEKMPDAKSPEQLEQEAKEARPEHLKAQDRGFQKEAKEADDYLRKFK